MSTFYLSAFREGRHEGWRYIATLALVVWFFISVSFFLALLAILIEGNTDINHYQPLTLLLLGTLPFPLGGLLGLALGMHLFHRQPLLALINPSGRIAWSRFWLSLGLWLLLCGLGDVILWLINPTNYVWAFQWERFWPYALTALVLIPLQSGTEELIFRGYLTQWVGRGRRSLWLPLLLPNLVFALLHGLNPEVQTYGAGLTLPLYFAIGLLLSWITLKSGGLELALGLHAANNYYAALAVTFPASALPSPALIQMRIYNPLLGLVTFLITAGVYLLVIFRIIPGLSSPGKKTATV